MGELRCWWCGVEPERIDTYDVTVMESATPIRQITHAQWPEGDHDHAEHPPSPAQIEQAGHEALTRILAQVERHA